MRVLYVIHNQAGTGPYPKVVEQAEALVALGAEATVLCTSKMSRFRMTRRQEGNVDIVEAPDLLWGRLRQGLDLWNVLRRCLWLRAQRFDVVHAVDCRPAVLGPVMMARSMGVPTVLSWWDYFGGGGTALERSGSLYARTLGKFEGFLERFGRRFASHATVISSFLGERLAELGYPRDRTTLVRLGCNTHRFPVMQKREARAALGLPVDATILCYVGALMPADRDLLIATLDRLRRGGEKDLIPILVGTPPLDAADVQRLGIRLVPRQPLETVHRYISAADLCLLPFRTSVANMARWPSKSADYLNAGRPIVATPVSDFPKLFAKHRLGFLSESDEPEAYAAAVREALSARAEWDAMGKTCRAFAVSELDVAALGARLHTIYSRVITERKLPS